MSHEGRCKWIGASGNRYTYAVYRLPCRFYDNQPGNYIFAKVDAKGRWIPIFVGHGDIGTACTSHEKLAEIRARGATHFHCHLRKDQLRRMDEEEDLLARYINAYMPYGCNEPLPSSVDDIRQQMAENGELPDLDLLSEATEPDGEVQIDLSASGELSDTGTAHGSTFQ